MIDRKSIRYGTLIFILCCSRTGYSAEPAFLTMVSKPNTAEADVIIDTRPLTSCKQSTVSGAVCLPIEDFIAPQQRLANWSGILWLLGTAGLGGYEHVAIIGEKPERRYILAGLLALAGQKRISLVEQPVSTLIIKAGNDSAGRQRSTTRTTVFTAPMRSHLIVLKNELTPLIHANNIILDGRSETEYFGTTILAQRGGHIPGAIHSPASQWPTTNNGASISAEPVLSYAHNAVSGLAFFGTLLARGQLSKLYLAGWAEWATDGALPIDSASYPQPTPGLRSTTLSQKPTLPGTLQLHRYHTLVGAAIAVCLLMAGFFAGRGQAVKRT